MSCPNLWLKNHLGDKLKYRFQKQEMNIGVAPMFEIYGAMEPLPTLA